MSVCIAVYAFYICGAKQQVFVTLFCNSNLFGMNTRWGEWKMNILFIFVENMSVFMCWQRSTGKKKHQPMNHEHMIHWSHRRRKSKLCFGGRLQPVNKKTKTNAGKTIKSLWISLVRADSACALICDSISVRFSPCFTLCRCVISVNI